MLFRISLLFQSTTQGLPWRDLQSCYVWLSRFACLCFFPLLSLFMTNLASSYLGLCLKCKTKRITCYHAVSILINELILSIQEAEKHLSEMVVSKALVTKIDRPMGIVCFQVAKNSNEILNSWAVNLEKLLDLVEKSCHQIHKETMVHKAALKPWYSLIAGSGICHILLHVFMTYKGP